MIRRPSAATQASRRHQFFADVLVPVLVSIWYLRILVQRLLLCLMGLPRVLLPSGRDLLSRGTVKFLAIFVPANGYPW